MNLINMTNKAQVHEFYNKIKKRKFIFFNHSFERVIKVGNECKLSAKYLQNYNSSEAKKNTGTRCVNTAIYIYKCSQDDQDRGLVK